MLYIIYTDMFLRYAIQTLYNVMCHVHWLHTEC